MEDPCIIDTGDNREGEEEGEIDCIMHNSAWKQRLGDQKGESILYNEQ